MKKQALRTDLCSRFCSYFKPEKGEGLACEGYLVVEKLLAEGRHISFDRGSSMPGPRAVEILASSLCFTCPFSEDGCDFASGVENALPCGGFIFLGQLLEAGIISVDDVRRMH